MTPNILVVENDLVIQELLDFNLKQCGYRMIQALDAASAMKHINKSLPDLILLDWMLPLSSGIELVRRLRASQRTRDIPIIMLTTRNAECDKELGLDSGADDYVTKPFSPRELIARIRAKLRRFKPHVSDQIIRSGGLELTCATHQIKARGAIIDIRPTEFRVLLFFMTNSERIYSRSELLDQLWGDHVDKEERAVDVHIRKLRQALEPYGLNDLVQTVRGIGYRFNAASTILPGVVSENGI